MNKVFNFKMTYWTILIALIMSSFMGIQTYAATNDLFNFPDKIYSYSSEDDLKGKIMKDADFIKEHAVLANRLGFAWCGGTASTGIGRDFSVSRKSDSRYEINANYRPNDAHSDGYRSNERLKMTFDNIGLYIDGNSLSFGTARLKDPEPQLYYTTYVVNEGNNEITAKPKISYTTEDNWSRSDDYSFGQSLSVMNKYEFSLGFMGAETEISIGLDFSQGWSTTSGGSESKTVEYETEVTVPPKSKRKVNFILLKNKAEIPYSAKTFIEYDVTFNGFLKWSGNAHVDHPTDRPTVSKTFGAGNMNAADDLRSQYLHRDINGYSEWDWEWYRNSFSAPYLIYDISAIANQRRGGIVEGTFTGISSAVCNVEVSAEQPLDGTESSQSSRVKRDASLVYLTNGELTPVENVKLVSVTLN